MASVYTLKWFAYSIHQVGHQEAKQYGKAKQKEIDLMFEFSRIAERRVT
jgi:hypothetical protein